MRFPWRKWNFYHQTVIKGGSLSLWMNGQTWRNSICFCFFHTFVLCIAHLYQKCILVFSPLFCFFFFSPHQTDRQVSLAVNKVTSVADLEVTPPPPTDSVSYTSAQSSQSPTLFLYLPNSLCFPFVRLKCFALRVCFLQSHIFSLFIWSPPVGTAAIFLLCLLSHTEIYFSIPSLALLWSYPTLELFSPPCDVKSIPPARRRGWHQKRLSSRSKSSQPIRAKQTFTPVQKQVVCVCGLRFNWGCLSVSGPRRHSSVASEHHFHTLEFAALRMWPAGEHTSMQLCLKMAAISFRPLVGEPRQSHARTTEIEQNLCNRQSVAPQSVLKINSNSCFTCRLLQNCVCASVCCVRVCVCHRGMIVHSSPNSLLPDLFLGKIMQRSEWCFLLCLKNREKKELSHLCFYALFSR